MTTLGRFVLLVGDLNIHIERGNDLHTTSLLETFDSFNMQNVVNEPTHECGGILDLIVSTHNFPVSSCKVYPSNIYSDHGFVSALLPIPRPPIKKIYKKVRAWNSIGNSNFVTLVKKSSIGGVCQFQNADEAFYFFNSELMSILDKVVPTHEVLSRYVPSAPWFDAECRTCKRYCRVRERKFRNDNCKKNRDEWVNALISKNRLFSQKREFYWGNLVKINEGNPKKIWGILNKILCRDVNENANVDTTSHNSKEFADFFREKVEKIKLSTGGFGDPIFVHCQLNEPFSGFSECTQVDVKAIIMSSPAKTCFLDCMPTNIFKKYIDLFLPFLTSLINLWLSTGNFPSGCKHAIVVPLLKQSSLDGNDKKNYRPVSNLSFISKVIERIVAKQLLFFLHSNNLMPQCQSGYRRFHSCETALLHVLSNLYSASDAKQISLLALLDMSAAFDCVDHITLLRRLSSSYGISGNVYAWFESYLNKRSQQIYYNNVLSDNEFIASGVPQDSVLGPILFILYVADVFEIIERFGFKGHAYADDIQVVASCPPVLFDEMTDKFLDCLSCVDIWMAQNGIRLNQCKTQLLPVGTWQQISKIDANSLSINGTHINFCKFATNLGFTIDGNLSMHEHIKGLVKSCSNQLRELRLIRKSSYAGRSNAFVYSFAFGLL